MHLTSQQVIEAAKRATDVMHLTSQQAGEKGQDGKAGCSPSPSQQEDAWANLTQPGSSSRSCFSDHVLRSIAAAEMYKPDGRSHQDGTRHTPTRRYYAEEKLWPDISDPTLQKLLTHWESARCPLKAEHSKRIGTLQRYLGFERDVAPLPSLTPTVLFQAIADRTRVENYCSFLEKYHLSAQTIKKRLQALRNALQW